MGAQGSSFLGPVLPARSGSRRRKRRENTRSPQMMEVDTPPPRRRYFRVRPKQTTTSLTVGSNMENPVEVDIACIESQKIKLGKLLGSGANGSAYVSCTHDSCDYVVKVAQDTGEEDTEYEIALQASQGNYGPKIEKKWACRGTTVADGGRTKEIPLVLIFMQKLDKTLEQYLEEGGVITPSNAADLVNTLTMMADDGVMHNDMKPDNLMVSLNEDGSIKRFYVIDYGWSWSRKVNGRWRWEVCNGWNGPPPMIEGPDPMWDTYCLYSYICRYYTTKTASTGALVDALRDKLGKHIDYITRSTRSGITRKLYYIASRYPHGEAKDIKIDDIGVSENF